MTGYRLATYRSALGARAGAVVDGTLYDVAELVGVPGYATVLDVLEDWDRAHPAIAAAAASPACRGQPVETAALMAPVPRPGAIYCAGSNYRDHAEEMRLAGGRAAQPDPRTLGEKPWFFIKSTHTVAGPGASVDVAGYSKKLDWEIELAVIIGRKARDLSAETALACVAGYTIANDLSARDLSRRPNLPVESLFRADWLRHKSFDNAAPMGPWMTPAAFIGDPANLAMQLWVNGVLKQDSNSANMIFNAAEQIAQLSSGMTLHPGDIVMTGTPSGVGMGRNEFLAPGDVVRMRIADIGEMSFAVAPPPDHPRSETEESR